MGMVHEYDVKIEERIRGLDIADGHLYCLNISNVSLGSYTIKIIDELGGFFRDRVVSDE